MKRLTPPVPAFWGLGIYDWPILSLIPGWALIGSLIVFLLGGVVAAGAAFLIGKLTWGLRADYLAIATLGISEIVIFFSENEEWLTRGVKNVTTLPRPITQPVDLIEAAWFQNFVNGWLGGAYTDEQLRSAASLVVKLGYVALFSLVLLVIFVLAQRALNSPWGRMMRAIRDNEVSANAMGKNIVGRHLEVFVLGSAVVGIAGAMLTTVVGQFTPTEYIPLRFTFLIWVMVIVGGSGNNFGSVLGGFLIWFVWILAEPLGGSFMNWATTSAIFFVLPSIQDLNATLAQHLVDVAPQIRLMLMGIVLLLVLRFSPSGILPEVVPGRSDLTAVRGKRTGPQRAGDQTNLGRMEMKKFLVAASALAMTAGAAMADGHGVKIGVVLGYTGPIETLTGPMGNAADLAIAEANAAGNFFGGTIEGVRGDTTYVDSVAATAATERVVAEGVVAIVGGDCSGVTGAMLQNVARPNGVVMISTICYLSSTVYR